MLILRGLARAPFFFCCRFQRAFRGVGIGFEGCVTVVLAY
jgi:hypothetical protein